MKRLLPFLLVLAASCNNEDKKASSDTPEDDLDAARTFIRANLDGRIEDARKLLLEDSVNLQYFNVFERNYEKMDPESKRMYRESSINIHKHRMDNDSTGILIFSNSYRNDHDTLRIQRIAGAWKVDLKYLFEHPADTVKPTVPVTPSSDTTLK